MDVGLPGISGIETAVMIRSKYENINKKTPIIAVTANHDQATRDRCIEALSQKYFCSIEGFILGEFMPPVRRIVQK